MNESANEPTLRRLNLFEHARYETFLREEWHGREAEWIGITRLLYLVVSYLDNLTPSRVLDLSPGSGLTTVELARLGGEVDGPGWHIVAGARSNEDQQTIRESVEEAGVSSRVESVDVVDPRDLSRYPDGSFDVVLAPTIFQESPDADDRHLATSEISRVLRDDGWAIFIAEMCERWTVQRSNDIEPSGASGNVPHHEEMGHQDGPSGRHDRCFSAISDMDGLLEEAGLSLHLGETSIYIGSARSIADVVWDRLRETGEEAFDDYLIELEDRDTGLEPEGQVVDLIVAARKWTLARSREDPQPIEEPRRSTLRTLLATQVLDLREVAEGWHVLNVSVGPNDDPILLLVDKTWIDRPADGLRPHTRMRITHIDHDVTRIIELPENNVAPFVQPLRADRWLAVYRQAFNEQDHSACIYKADGSLMHTFHAGFWAHLVQTTTSGKIWVGYPDMGTFQDRDFTPLFRCFDANGNSLLEPGKSWAFIDCYALNVETDDAVWLYLYTGFPLVRINSGAIDKLYPAMPVRGSGAFAVHEERALFAGRYRDFETLYHVSLRSMAVEPYIPVTEAGTPITFNRSGNVGRGSRLYLVTDEALYMVDLADL